MKRFITALAVLAVLGAGACDSASTPAAPGVISPGAGTPLGPTAQARATACTTIKAARIEALSAFAEALVAYGDTSTSQADLTRAASEFGTALTAFGASMTNAAGQTTDPALKAAATTYATTIATMKTETAAAGGDRTKLTAAANAAPFKTAERSLIDLCADVWAP